VQGATTIAGRFNGPPGSGNGGYSCGLLAAHLGGPARIRLHVPPPLDTALRVAATDDGGMALYAGDTLVASGVRERPGIEVPAPPPEDAAYRAMAEFPWYQGHPFPTCFVCGPEREHRDGLDVFPGPVPGTTLWACRWQPAPDLLDGAGHVRPEILWSALDCPGFFAASGGTPRPAVLGELVAELRCAVPATLPLVVYAWPLGVAGRKLYAGTAIARAGEVVASARSTWIALKT